MKERRHILRQWWLYVAAALLLIIGLVVYFALNPRMPHVSTASVHRQTLQNKIFATGTVKPVSRQIIMPAQLPAPIEKANVAMNQAVKRGDVLLTLQNSTQKASLDAASLTVQQARQGLAQARRQQATAPIGMQSQLAGPIASAETALIQAQSDLTQAQTAYDATFVRASLDGTVILLNPEGVAADGTAAPVLEVVGTERQVVIHVSEVDAVHIHPGMTAELTSDAYPNTNWTATVKRVAEFAAAGASGTGQVEVDLTPQDAFTVPYGYDIDVHIISLTHKAVPAVPYAALTQGTGDSYVVYVVHGNHVQRVAVTLGITTDDWVEVTKGVKPGDWVVLNPPSSLRDGEVVATS